jgi:hypothetical protein
VLLLLFTFLICFCRRSPFFSFVLFSFFLSFFTLVFSFAYLSRPSLLSFNLSFSFSKNQTRLIVVGSNLSVQYWNIHDGTNLIQVFPQLYSTSLAHIYSNYPKTVVFLTQDIFFPATAVSSTSSSSSDSTIPSSSTKEGITRTKPLKLLLLVTDFGHICVYPEHSAIIEPIPSAFLRASDMNDKKIAFKRKQFAPKEKKVGKISFRTVALKARELKTQGQFHLAEEEEREVTEEEEEGEAATSGEGEKKEGAVDDDEEEGDRNESHKKKSIKLPAGVSNSIITTESSVITEADMINDRPQPSTAEAQRRRKIDLSKDPVIWMHILPNTTHLLTCYLSGRLILWDLETDHKLQDFYLGKNQFGAILNGMRMKNAKLPAGGGALTGTTGGISPMKKPSSPRISSSVGYSMTTAMNNKVLEEMKKEEEAITATVMVIGQKNEETAGKESKDSLSSLVNGGEHVASPGSTGHSGVFTANSASGATVPLRPVPPSSIPPSQEEEETTPIVGEPTMRAPRATAFSRKISTNSHLRSKRLKNSIVMQIPDLPQPLALQQQQQQQQASSLSDKKDLVGERQETEQLRHRRLESIILAVEKEQKDKSKKEASSSVTLEEDDEDEVDDEGEPEEVRRKKKEENKQKQKKMNKFNQRKGQKREEEEIEYYDPDDHRPLYFNENGEEGKQDEEEDDFTKFKKEIEKIQEEEGRNVEGKENDEEDKKKKKEMKLRLQFMQRQATILPSFSASSASSTAATKGFGREGGRKGYKDSAALTIFKHSDLLLQRKASISVSVVDPFAYSPLSRVLREDERKETEATETTEEKEEKEGMLLKPSEMKEYAKQVKQSLHSSHKLTLRMNQTTITTPIFSSESPTSFSSSQQQSKKSIISFKPSQLLGGVRPLSTLEELSQEEDSTSFVAADHGGLEGGSSLLSSSFLKGGEDDSPASLVLLPSKLAVTKHKQGLKATQRFQSSIEEEDSGEMDDEEDPIHSLSRVEQSSTRNQFQSGGANRLTLSNALRATSTATAAVVNHERETGDSSILSDDEEEQKGNRKSTAMDKKGERNHGATGKLKTELNVPSVQKNDETAGVKIVVDFLVVLPDTQVMIG